MPVHRRNNVNEAGAGPRAMMFAHGFGCDQNMWRFVAPAFQDAFHTVLFDHVGAGRSDIAAYDRTKYASLEGYADDVVEIGRDLNLRNAVFVGHSVSAMIGVLAANRAPELFSELILVCPSPRYIDDEGYRGGFTAGDVEDILASLDDNYMGWSAAMAPAIMGNPTQPELSAELNDSFCRTDPEIAGDFARATFNADNRNDLPQVRARTLVLQCREDILAPQEVGEYVRDHIPRSELVVLNATGHCPNLSAPKEVVSAMRSFLSSQT